MRSQLRQTGSALLALLVIVIICGAIAGAVLYAGLGENRSAQASLERERAFQLAESGIDLGVAVIRRNKGALPSTTTYAETMAGQGVFNLSYTSGTANGIDDDRDGIADEPDESDYVVLRSVGRAAQMARAIQVVLRRSVQVPQIEAAVQLNVATPILDLKGNDYLVSGFDHDINGVVDTSVPTKSGIASPDDVADLVAQVPAVQYDQIEGSGGTPSIAQVPPMDLNALVDEARLSASVSIEPGTHTNLEIGTPTPEGVVVAYAGGDIQLTGNNDGAGILVVDGDLRISGSFTWRGLVLVRGRVQMVGGGGTKRIIGGLIIGEEIESVLSETEVTVTGTVDLLYSSEAIRLATKSLVIMSVVSWSETAAP